MQLEIEQKFPIDDCAGLLRTLEGLGCQWRESVEQSDLYFAHPARDFRQTDEALRLRRSGDEVVITYKGPKLGTVAKTRRELELPIAGGAVGYDQYRELLEILGFRPVREVRKTRLPGAVPWQGTDIEVSVDEVAELGQFVELEILAPPERLEQATLLLTSLSTRLNLVNSERRGYLQMLLASAAESN